MASKDNYEQLLDNIYENLPDKVTSGERFDMPKFEYFTEGNKTIIRNYKSVVDTVRREGSFLSKYLSKELAVPAEVQGERLILQRRLVGDILNKKLEEFVTRYVICKECKKPDTKLEDSGHGFKKLICESCGAHASIR